MTKQSDKNSNHRYTLQVAVPVPLRKLFDYQSDTPVMAGFRVLVPFGPRKLTGVVVSDNQATGDRRLKKVIRVLDADPVFDDSLMDLLSWAVRYYHHPAGEVFVSALPVLLRSTEQTAPPRGLPLLKKVRRHAGEVTALLTRAPSQTTLYGLLEIDRWIPEHELVGKLKGWGRAKKGLLEKGLIEKSYQFDTSRPPSTPPLPLNKEQQVAADFISEHLGGFRTILLQGITGSGKTEVYLAAARKCITEGRQVLFLVPEISLTPQLIQRVSAQLGGVVCAMHSGMTNRARYESWWQASEGIACALLGTRSAVFTKMKNLGLIVVDEEHDGSYKQQDGFRYHARDLAIKRASLTSVPVVLGSATPCIETLQNAQSGKHGLAILNTRIGSARLPTVETIDLNKHVEQDGVSEPVMSAINHCLTSKHQAIVYINRRGFAPLVHCYECQWQAVCDQCNARMTVHRHRRQFRCHHCGHVEKAVENCPQCTTPLYYGGAGTQRVEQALTDRFPDARISRLDRDQANTTNKLYRQLEAIRNGEVDIIVGTQLITKGHDFGNVSLVCVINADYGLYSADFRASETMFQQLLQVAGRAGRASVDGQVLIQTRHPDNPILQRVKQHDYHGFVHTCLEERRLADFPPFSHFALMRAESPKEGAAISFLLARRKLLTCHAPEALLGQVEVMRPVPSPMEKLAGQYRAQLLIRSSRRPTLHSLLTLWLPLIEQSGNPGKIRWSLDVDPLDMS